MINEPIHEIVSRFNTFCSSESTLPIEEAYTIPQHGDWPFAFTRIDAVYIWTQGGYQVSRNPSDYSLFVAVYEDDVQAWETFFESVDLPTGRERRPSDAVDGSIQVVLEPRSKLEIASVEGYPVIPLDETLAYMHENYVQFQPAVSMLEEMYDDQLS